MTDHTTIDDTLPSCIVKMEDGKYTFRGRLLQYHVEPGYIFVRLENMKGDQDVNMFAFREEPGYTQNELVRADMAAMVCELKKTESDKHSVFGLRVNGELLPKEWGESMPNIRHLRGMRMTSCKNTY